MNYKNITLEKGMYHHPVKSFDQILEELDPSENYIGSPLEKLTAFQRQLKRFDIKVNGPNSDYVNKFYQNSNSAALFPNFLTHCVKEGMMRNGVLKKIVASEDRIDNLSYHNMSISSTNEENIKMNSLKEGENVPETKLKINDESQPLKKLGCMLTAGYETIEFQKINSFNVALQRIGHCLYNSIIEEAINVLINGDRKNPAETVTSKEKQRISFEDLVQVWTKFENFEMNTIIAHPAMIIKMAEINEYKTTLAKLDFPNNGAMFTPFGADIIRTIKAPKDALVCLDRKFAINQVTAKDLTIDSDKVIDKQIIRTTFFTITGFSKICEKAAFVLKCSA